MSSDGEYKPDDEDVGASSSVSSDEETSDFIASDDDESLESNDDMSYHQPPELSEEENCNTTTQHATSRAKRQCTTQTNEKMSQIISNETMDDEEVFGTFDNDTQDLFSLTGAPSSKVGTPSSQYQYNTPTRNRGTRRKCIEQKMHQMLEEEDLSDEEVFGSEDDVSGAPSSNLGALSSHYQYVTPRKARGNKRRKCTIQTNEKMSQMLEEEGMNDEEVFGSDTQDMGRNLMLGAPSSKFDAPSKQNKLTKHNSRRRERKRNGSDYVDSDGNNGGTLRKVGKGSSCNLDSVFAFHGTSSEEDNELPIPVTRSSKKSRRRRSSNNGSLSRRSLQNELLNEFDIDSSDGEESIEYENQSSNHEGEGGSSDGGESSEEPSKKDSHLMGSKVLYCCPICYKKAYQSQGNLGGNVDRDDSSVDSESSSDDDGDRKMAADPFLFQDDPICILTNIGLETAATFCFETLGGDNIDIGVKDHLKTVHDVDPSTLVDNELFHRFQIRGRDGLLQHWLRDSGAGRLPEQKDMQDYWRDGNSELFLQLHRMVQKMHREMIHSCELISSSFSETFPNRAKNMWIKLSSPFLKQEGDDSEESNHMDMNEDEDIEQQEEYMPPPVLPGDEESNAEEYVAQYLPNLSDPVCRERYSQELQEEYDANNLSSDQSENDSYASDEAASNTISFLVSDHSNNRDFVAMADGTWKPKDDEDSISSLSKEENENESGEESDHGEEEDSADESSEEEPDEWLKEKKMKPTAARQKERSNRQNNSSESDSSNDDDASTVESAEEENDSGGESDHSEEAEFDENESEEEQEEEKKTKPTSRQRDDSSDSDEDDSLRPSHISPNGADVGGDLVDTDDEQPARMQPRQLKYSPEKKKKRKMMMNRNAGQHRVSMLSLSYFE